MNRLSFAMSVALAALAITPFAFSDMFVRGVDRQQAYYEREQLIKCQEGYQRYCQMIVARQEAQR